MALTVASAITRCQRLLQSMSSTIALEYLQIIHDELLTEQPINITTEDISLVSGTREYAINTLDARIWSADLHLGASDIRPLIATSVPALNAKHRNWRQSSNSTPSTWYPWRNTAGNVVGFHPAPDQTTSTYPFVRLVVSRKTTLATDGNLPESLQSSDPYVFGACLKHAIDHQMKDRIEELTRWYEEAKLKQKNALSFFAVEAPPEVVPWMSTIGGPGHV